MKITLTAASLPSSFKSLNLKTSAIMKPFSKSEWIRPPACGALVPFFKYLKDFRFHLINLNKGKRYHT